MLWIFGTALTFYFLGLWIGKGSAENEMVDLRCDMRWQSYKSNMRAMLKELDYWKGILAEEWECKRIARANPSNVSNGTGQGDMLDKEDE